ncbi:MAG: hemerythrin domain-containing protein [Gammaproteobacteria bacterium]|nr:hemerythrin domain-containing protein [Gammaproteobacteria bacterium]
MMDVMRGLHRDHAHLSEIRNLACLELAAIEGGQHEDYCLLEDIMRYVTGYPDTHHHPTEDIVFAQLKARAPGTAPEVDRILADHAALLVKGRRFLEAIQAVEEGTIMRRDEFVDRGQEYLSSLGEHMRVEESRLFPLAKEHLSDADWDEIGRRVQRQDDPVFGASVDEDYRQLWQRIQSQRQTPAD